MWRVFCQITKNGQAPKPFGKLLQDPKIIFPYILLGSPYHNGMVEKRNQTLMGYSKKHEE